MALKYNLTAFPVRVQPIRMIKKTLLIPMIRKLKENPTQPQSLTIIKKEPFKNGALCLKINKYSIVSK